MTSHIDVVSYLLGATVFSVGFLSTRLHAAADSARRETSDASWRVRDALMRAERLAPAEIGGLLTIVRARRDPIAIFARIVNVALTVAVLIVFIDAVRLISIGTPHPQNALLLMLVLVAGAIAVGIVGEADARHVESRLEKELSQTTLGRLEQVNEALSRANLSDARKHVQDLRTVFPTWGLLSELRAYIALRNDDSEEALQLIEAHVASEEDVYLSGLIATAAASILDRPDVALRMLDDVNRLRSLSAEEIMVKRGLRLRAAQLDELLDGDLQDVKVLGSSSKKNTARPFHTSVAGTLFEGAASADQGSAFDIRADSISELRGLLEHVRNWNRPLPTGPIDDRGPFGLFWHLVNTPAPYPPQMISAITKASEQMTDGQSVEAIGFVLLALGHPRLALNVFERAIALRPKAARVHWGHGVSCWRWGWLEKARESVGRALTLDRDNPVFRITRRRLDTNSMLPDENLASPRLSSWASLPTQRFQLALLGLPPPSEVKPPSCKRESFAQHLTALAFSASNRTQQESSA